MSAVEKLKALQQPLDEFHISGPYYEAMAHLVRVHPQIVAVVRAAEIVMADLKPGLPENDLNGEADLRAALTALDEALGDVT